MVCPRTAFTRGAASSAVTIGYVTWSSMMLGGCPSQFVWMITCTSEMSGSASSGMLLMDHIPASTMATVPVKTRKRLFAHHSMIREIMSHASRGVHRQLLVHDGAAILLCGDRDLPCPAGAEFAVAFVQTGVFIGAVDHSFHRRHSHRRHGRHEEGDRHLRSGNRRSLVIGKFHAEDVAALVRR